MLSHEAEVGVKRTWKRLCFSSQRIVADLKAIDAMVSLQLHQAATGRIAT
jgi:hypothetical protein